MKNNRLRGYFPMLKTKEEVMAAINQNRKLKSVFNSWRTNAQQEFIDFCTEQRGIKILYDSFFKEVFNPEYAPERLNRLLSVILGMKVRIIQVLPLDSTRMGDETSLVTMDIVVELEDKSIVNKNFAYSRMKPVYTIVFFENSPQVFKSFPNDYIHIFTQKSDTGLSLELLQKYVFIPLDIYKQVSHNILNELDAWLTFLSSDSPDDILYLIENFPEFKPMYETLFNLCENIEGVMDMFSKELYELDRNTALFMVDDMSREINELKAANEEKDNVIAEKDNTIAELQAKLKELKQNQNKATN